MAELNFPSSPTIDQIYTFGEKKFRWDGVKWIPMSTVSTSGTYPACFRDSGSMVIENSTYYLVDFDTKEFDPENNYTVSNTDITVSDGGYYNILYSVPLDQNGPANLLRGNFSGWVDRDQTTSIWTTISQSYTQDYSREDSGGQGVSGGFIVKLEDGEKIRLAVKLSHDQDMVTKTGASQMSIYRVRV